MENENTNTNTQPLEYDPSQPVAKLAANATGAQRAAHDAAVEARGEYLVRKPLLSPAEQGELARGIAEWAKGAGYRG